MHRLFTVAFCWMLALGAAQGAAPRLHLVCQRGKENPEERANLDLKLGEAARLALVLESRSGKGAPRFLSDFDGPARIGGKTVSVARFDDSATLTIQWFKVEPLMMHQGKGADPTVPDFLWYTNAYSPRSPNRQRWIGFDRITYQENELAAEQGKWSIAPDARPTDTRYDRNQGLGVMRYAARLTLGNRTLRTPGSETAGELGIGDEVFRLTVRRDDSFTGYATSYFNVPGVFGSVGPQVDRYLGVDCADLVVGTWRKWRKASAPAYTNVNGLIGPMHSRGGVLYLVESGELFKDPELKTPAQTPFKPGLAVLFDYPGTVSGHYDHVAILYRDNGNGVIDGNDEILHAGPMEPTVSLLRSQGGSMTAPTRIRLLEP